MTKIVFVGSTAIGGGNKIAIQSMTTARAADVDATVRQINKLQSVGCDIVRVAVLDKTDALAIKAIKNRIAIPLVADIHFNDKFAILAIENGADKIRINPGNVSTDKLRDVIKCAKQRGVAIRIGVNGGSVNKDYLAKYGDKTKALCFSLLDYVKFFEDNDFTDLVLSLKSSDVKETVDANTIISGLTDYPLHIGVTEAGVKEVAVIKNSIGIGSLLLKGIGDTIRVSVTADPIEEVFAAKNILSACGKYKNKLRFVSCPACGRCQVNLENIASRIYRQIKDIECDLSVAVMGCAVNGPGEAADADMGIAFGKDKALLFKHGKIAGELSSDGIVEKFVSMVKEAAKNVVR